MYSAMSSDRLSAAKVSRKVRAANSARAVASVAAPALIMMVTAVLRLTEMFVRPPNALVQLQAHYHHCGEAASEKCLSAATFVRQHVQRYFAAAFSSELAAGYTI